jgi:hypothetical protein
LLECSAASKAEAHIVKELAGHADLTTTERYTPLDRALGGSAWRSGRGLRSEGGERVELGEGFSGPARLRCTKIPRARAIGDENSVREPVIEDVDRIRDDGIESGKEIERVVECPC